MEIDKKTFASGVLVAIVVVLSICILVSILIPAQKRAILNFRREAREHLGTEDFTITMQDILVARTPDGRQYPSEDFVRTYYRNKLILYGGTLALGLLLSFVLVIILGRNEQIKNG